MPNEEVTRKSQKGGGQHGRDRRELVRFDREKETYDGVRQGSPFSTDANWVGGILDIAACDVLATRSEKAGAYTEFRVDTCL